jgi:prevent-host-death family protein
MAVVGLRQLSRETREVIDQLKKDGEPIVITERGTPIAAISPLSQADAAAYALALAPEFVAGRERAAAAIERGEGELASQVLAELEADEDIEMPATNPDFEFPDWLLERVVTVAIGSGVSSAEAVEAGVSQAEAIKMMNMELVETLMRDSVASVAERVRTVNENIAKKATAEAGVSVDAYVDELRRVTDSERLLERQSASAVSRKIA